MKQNFLDKLNDSEVILFDGAIGTMIYNKGIFFNQCFDEINISNPKIIKEIHTEYLKAGADVLTTNTFGANVPRLCEYGFAEKIENINKKGVEIAKTVISEFNKENSVYIAGCIGPLGIKVEPLGILSQDKALNYFKQQAQYLYDAGADLIILETFVDLNEIKIAIKAIKEVCNLPLIAEITIKDDGTSIYGTKPELYTTQMDQWGADIVGTNCSDGPRSMLEAVEKIVKSTDKPIIAQPNAGIPRNIDGRNIYLCTPEYMTEYAKRFILKGVSIVGGCCGTTPAHIKEMEKVIRSLKPRKIIEKKIVITDFKNPVNPLPIEERSAWGKKMTEGKFIHLVELLPPKGIKVDKILNNARILKEHNIDAVNIPDGPRATSRMSALASALLIKQKTGIEVVLHYTCRDRNLLGIQSDILGATALGLHNFLFITGDPPKMGGYADATAVFDIDSVGLCNLVNGFNHGYDLGNNYLGGSINAIYGVGVNPGAINIEYELNHLWWKLDAGAEFIITQPVFDIDIFYRFLEKIKHFPKKPIIAGIWPLTSYRNADFMNNEVPGASVPKKILDLMRNCNGKNEAREEGVMIARNTYEKLKDIVQGVQISAPMGDVNHALKILK
jgi:homocysteine S-methyltransferase